MTWPFALIAGLTVGSAIAAMALRQLVHCALSLVVTFAGLAALYLQLNAEFVGFVQVLVYVGAVAILIVFAILLTRGSETQTPAPVAAAPAWGVGIAVAAFLVMAGAVMSSTVTRSAVPPSPELSVKRLGDKLMEDYLVPLEVLGLLLTAAMIGGVLVAMTDRRPRATHAAAAPAIESAPPTR